MVKAREGAGRGTTSTNDLRLSVKGKGKWVKIAYPGKQSIS